MFITNIDTILPKYSASQENTISWLKWAHNLDSRLVERVACKPTQISKRYFELPDFNTTDPNKMKIFGSEAQHSMQNRLAIFKEATLNAFERFYASTHSKLPEYLIHTTCTGYTSPSPAQVYASSRAPQTQVIHAYHMGCYAAIPSIEIAAGLVANSKNSTADIVHTELCTLHMNRSDHSPEQLVIQSLFADGYAKVSVGTTKPKSGLKILATLSELIPNTLDMMTWETANWGMHMTLSREVPSVIEKHLKLFLDKICAKANIDLHKSWNDITWAIHPGGPRILDAVKDKFELTEKQIQFSRKVLFENGNLSSATIPHVLKACIESPECGSLVIALAFGPGLTIAGAVFEKV